MRLRLKGLDQVEEFGIRLGKLLKAGDILGLVGDLGAGKTTMTKSIGLGLEVDEYITSPTFALINEYRGRIPVYHFDVYRLENVEELYDIGFDEYFYGQGVSIIEWADKIESILPKNRIMIDIGQGDYQDERYLSIYGQGDRYKEIIKELK